MQFSVIYGILMLSTSVSQGAIVDDFRRESFEDISS